jgi:starch synthase (maltosyl-transferring)
MRAPPFEPGQPISLEPLSARLFRGHGAPLKPVRRASKGAQQAAEKRLFELAANRVVIERVEPELDGSRHAIKRVVGEAVEVQADIFATATTRSWRASGTAQDEGRARAPRTSTTTAGAAASRSTATAATYTIEAWRDLLRAGARR